jgi:hypothetical protein
MAKSSQLPDVTIFSVSVLLKTWAKRVSITFSFSSHTAEIAGRFQSRPSRRISSPSREFSARLRPSPSFLRHFSGESGSPRTRCATKHRGAIQYVSVACCCLYGRLFVKRLERCSEHSFYGLSAHAYLGFREGRCRHSWLAASCLGRAQRSSPKPCRVARRRRKKVPLLTLR